LSEIDDTIEILKAGGRPALLRLLHHQCPRCGFGLLSHKTKMSGASGTQYWCNACQIVILFMPDEGDQDIGVIQ
jgi:hypothetical protein